MVKSLISEYGLIWLFNRILYSVKLKLLKYFPISEYLFEKKVDIKRVDIFNIDVYKIERFLNKLSDENKNTIINIADRAVDGKIRAFSSIELDFGNPINWHFNPLTRMNIDKNIKWYRIPDFNSKVGDIKVIWEASRFTHFFYFARAYMLTKDIKYYKAFSNQLDNWLKENKYSYGVNYKCGQEAALRMINTLIAYSVFQAYGLTNGHDIANVKEIIKTSYKKVLSNFFYAHKCIRNNHTLSEITALIVGAWCSDDKKALNKAYCLLDKEIQYQFMEDGGYIQYSFNYQRFALQLIEFILKISNRTKISLSENALNLIKNSVILMYQLQDESGDMPNYGSNDGALIFPVTACGYRDFRPVLNSIYVHIQGKRLYQQGIYDEEILWFTDKDPNYLPIASLSRKSKGFKASGLYSLRHKDGFIFLVLQDFRTRPGQMDQMHIDLWHKGVNVLCDSGTYSYASDTGKKMALTGAHNTVKVDGKEQMGKIGHFLIYNWSHARDVFFNEDYIKGTMLSKNGYLHTRIIRKSLEGYTVEDTVKGKFENVEVLFHTPCDVKRKEYGLDLLHQEQLIAKILTNGELEITESYRSLYYMTKDKINEIIIKLGNNDSSIIKIILI